jgi:hypothetical protein
MIDRSETTLMKLCIDVRDLMMSNFQYRKHKSVLSNAVLSFIAIKIFADVHRAVFASAGPSQHLES